MGIRTRSHQCPWFLRQNIYIRISCWVLASIMLGTAHGALSPGVIYIGYTLINIIPISVISKYYHFEVMVTSFKMLYHFILSPNIGSSLNLNFISNKNDNHKQKYTLDMIIFIWIWLSVYEGSILLPSRVWLVFQSFISFFSLGPRSQL